MKKIVIGAAITLALAFLVWKAWDAIIFVLGAIAIGFGIYFYLKGEFFIEDLMYGDYGGDSKRTKSARDRINSKPGKGRKSNREVEDPLSRY